MASKQEDAGTAESVDYLALAERLDKLRHTAAFKTAGDFMDVEQAEAALREAHVTIEERDSELARALDVNNELSAEIERLKESNERAVVVRKCK
jgi:hypothetical protein